MQAGRYTVRAGWRPVSAGDRHLADAVIEFEDSGTVFVFVHGDPLFAFADREAFFGAHTITPRDLERTRHPRVATARPRALDVVLPRSARRVA